MKINQIGGLFLLLLIFPLLSELQAQPFNPEFKINQNPSINVNGTFTSPVSTNEMNLELDYLNNSTIPVRFPFITARGAYTPLETFWEFDYGGGMREYSFQKTPKMVFPQIAGTNKTVLVKLWTIDFYDDDEPPPKAFNFNINYSGNSTPKTLSFTESSIKVLPSWDPSPNDDFIYIIRLELADCESNLTGVLSFNYNDFKSKLVGLPTIYGVASDNGAGVISWNIANFTFIKDVNNAMSRYRDFYVGMKLKDRQDAPIGSELNSVTTFTPGANFMCDIPDGPIVKKDTIDISHDPNQKFTLEPLDVICTNSIVEGNSFIVDYKVEFQNIGAGVADTVTVQDWLDEKEHIKSVTLIKSKHTPAQSTLNYSVDGFVSWKFVYPNNGDLLRGKDEERYNIDFVEENTKSWLIFRVIYDTDAFESCNSLMNHARITFDCNPEFYTPTTINDFCCFNAGPGSPTTCEELETGFILTENLSQDTTGTQTKFSLKPGFITMLNGIFGTDANVNWYPDRWISDDNALDAVMSPLEDISYTLVISSDSSGVCKRSEYKVHIDVNDHGREDLSPMHLLDDDDPNDCTCTPVIVGGSPPYTYKWNDGSTGPSQSISTGIKTCILTVTDAHNCQETMVVTISCGSRIWLWGILGIFALFFIFGIGRWLRSRGGG